MLSYFAAAAGPDSAVGVDLRELGCDVPLLDSGREAPLEGGLEPGAPLAGYDAAAAAACEAKWCPFICPFVCGALVVIAFGDDDEDDTAGATADVDAVAAAAASAAAVAAAATAAAATAVEASDAEWDGGGGGGASAPTGLRMSETTGLKVLVPGGLVESKTSEMRSTA